MTKKENDHLLRELPPPASIAAAVKMLNETPITKYVTDKMCVSCGEYSDDSTETHAAGCPKTPANAKCPRCGEYIDDRAHAIMGCPEDPALEAKKGV